MLVAESAGTGDFSEMLPLITVTLFFPLRSGHISGTFLPALNTTCLLYTSNNKEQVKQAFLKISSKWGLPVIIQDVYKRQMFPVRNWGPSPQPWAKFTNM